MLTKTIELKHGFKVGEKFHRTAVLREVTTGDMLDAEDDAPANKRMQYNAALLARLLLSAGEFKGPFTVGMIRDLHPMDFAALQDVLYALDEEAGEGGAAAG